MHEARLENVAFVVVSRNGGATLERSLRSVLSFGRPVVYADSGSSDGSPDRAKQLGADVVVLDDSAPHTAARGRNAGFERLMVMDSHVHYVQFVDGDTTIDNNWPMRGAEAMRTDPALVVVCGHLREHERNANTFSRLFDMEWQGPVGEIRNTGGIAMIRAEAFKRVGGFRADLLAGEEADLCARLRLGGGRIVRLDCEMGEHDSGISRFGQWWRRASRVGYAYARAAAERGPAADVRRRRQVLSALFWAGVLPALLIALVIVAGWLPWMLALAACLMGAYGLLLARMYLGSRRLGRSSSDSWLFAMFCLIAKWPQLQGHMRFWMGR